MSSDLFTHHQVDTSQVTLHVVTAGDPSNDTLILLHGFPEYWQGWREVAERLVSSGYHVIIPDQRGYNTSDTPFWIGDYVVDKLAQDVADLVEWSGKEQVILAGHDWGAAVAWAAVTVYPDKFTKCIIVNVPHTRTFKKHLRSSFSQLRKSWYMFFFQLPLLPQFILRLFNFSMLRNTIVKSALPGTFTEEDIEGYTKAWRQSGVAPMLNWYRAAFRRRSKIWYDPIDVPVLIIWGKKDQFLSHEMAEKSLDFCNHGTLRYIEEATHWVLHEFPDEVATLIEEFMVEGSASD